MKTWRWPILGLLALLLLAADLIVSHSSSHEALWWEEIPYFFGIVGFFGCIAIIFISKLIGKVLLQREENYYDEF